MDYFQKIKKLNHYNFSDLSSYRTQIMGWAAIFVIVCHSVQFGVEMPFLLRRILSFGNLGVDIFLLLSGLGCYYSFVKKTRYLNWLKKRIMRIAVPYLVLHICLLTLEVPFGCWNLWDWLFYLSTIKFWVFHIGDWFIALIIPIYIITPIIISFFDKGGYRFTKFVILSAIILVFASCTFETLDAFTFNIVRNVQLAIMRVPAFLLGIFIAPYCKNGIRINLFLLFISLLLLCIITHNLFPSIFLYGFYVLPLTITLSCVAKCLYNFKNVNSLFVWAGDCSLESYIANVGIKAIIPVAICFLGYESTFFGNKAIQYFIVIFLGGGYTYIGHKISKQISLYLKK